MIHRPRSSGRWEAALIWMRSMWKMGYETEYRTPEFSRVRRGKLEVFFDDIHANYDIDFVDRWFYQWLGEMEMFRQEGGLQAYKRYRGFIENLEKK